MTAPAPHPQHLIEHCQGMVRSLALSIHRKLPPRYELDDLISYGQVGLAEAAKDFDPRRGSQFSTFAYYRIRGAIYDGISKMTWFGRAGRQHDRCEQRRKRNPPGRSRIKPANGHSQPRRRCPLVPRSQPHAGRGLFGLLRHGLRKKRRFRFRRSRLDAATGRDRARNHQAAPRANHRSPGGRSEIHPRHVLRRPDARKGRRATRHQQILGLPVAS